jgi:hypothetical protein
MDTNSRKTGLTRLPLWTAVFVALVCVVILAVTGAREWSVRQSELVSAEVSMGNLARSLAQHVEDSFDLLDASLFGALSRLEAEGTSPEVLNKLQKVLIARKANSKLIHGLVVADENGDWLTSSGSTGANLGDRPYFRHHRQSASRDALVGSAVRSKSNGEWIITLSRRFNHPDGSFACRGRHHRRPVFFRLLLPVRQRGERIGVAYEQRWNHRRALAR